jgi:hypothetical protein
MNVTSLLALPGFLGIDPSNILRQSDKVTAVVWRTNEADSLKSICSGIELDVEDSHITGAANYTELTGYPRNKG